MNYPASDELEWRIRRLQHSRNRGKLVFVLGAGINKEYGLPDWSDLLIELLKRSGRFRLGSNIEPAHLKHVIETMISDPLLQATAIQHAYPDPGLWLTTLRDLLRVPDDSLSDRSKPLGQIAKLVANQYHADHRRHVAVLTFNYDDLLETALYLEMGAAGFRNVRSVATATDMAQSIHQPGIYVYHLHGSLLDDRSEIVLDAQSYARILIAPGSHWSWFCMNLFLFQQDSAAIFLGLSLLDPNLRLLLTHAALTGLPLAALFVAKPLEPTVFNDITTSLQLAFIAHDVQEVFDDLLQGLSLIPYRVNEWSEISDLLERVAHD